MSFVRSSLLAMAMLGASASAHAQDKEVATNAAPKTRDYQGVHAGASGIQPPGAGKRAKGSKHIFWVGFEPQEAGRSRFFVQMGKELPVRQWLEGKTLVVHISGARVAHRSVLRRLDTSFFDSAVARVQARAVRRQRQKGERMGHDAGVQLRIEFKNPDDAAEAGTSFARGDDGYGYLYLEFRAGTDRPEKSQGGQDPADDLDLDGAETEGE